MNAVEIQGLTKRYGAITAVDSLDLTVRQGELFALLGVVSGVVAAIGAEVALALLQSKIFDFPWSPDWRLWVMLPLCGAILLSLCGGWLGLLGLRK